MGNKLSKPKTPYEILKVSPISTKEEVRLSFIRLIKGIDRNSKEFQEIVTAYNTIKKLPPPLDLYTDDLLSVYAKDLFEKIGDFSGVVCPPFGTKEFYKTFLNFQCHKKFKNEKEKEEFVCKVKLVTRKVKKLYSNAESCGAVQLVETKVEKMSLSQPPLKTHVPKEFNCTACKKGFRSTNQLLNHLKSKKHFNEIEKNFKNPREFVESQIKELEVTEPCEEEVLVEDNPVDLDTPTQDTEPEHPQKGFKIEPVPFRTCSRCKRIFESRKQMVDHIKVEHPL